MIVPVFNVEKYVKRALDSILNQTFPIEEIQVIMVDDASTDDSGKIIDEYANKYDNFEAVHLKENSGACAIPRNVGMKYVKADYIMFLDPDDEYVTNNCETLYNEIIKENADIVYCDNYTTWDNNKDYTIIEPNNEIKKIILNKNELPHRSSVCMGIHKTDLIKKNKIQFYNVIAEDFIFTIEEFIHMNKVIYLKNYYGYIYYKYSEFSHCSEPTLNKFYSQLKAYEIGRDVLIKNGKNAWIPTLLGRDLLYLYEKVSTLNISRSKKIELLREIYKFEESIDFNLKRPENINLGGKLSYFPFKLLEKRLFNLTLIYLKIMNISKRTKIIREFYNNLKDII